MYYVKCYTIAQYSVMENIELCTKFCSDELEAEDFSDDDSADDNSMPVTTVLRGNIIATTHLRSEISFFNFFHRKDRCHASSLTVDRGCKFASDSLRLDARLMKQQAMRVLKISVDQFSEDSAVNISH